MFKTFKTSFCLKNTYKTNSIIWSLKSIPIIKKLLPGSLYASKGLKLFANIISAIIEFFSIFLGKFLYLLLIYTQTQSMKASPEDNFTHLIVFFTIIGGILNTNIFNPTKDKYYAINLMRIDTKKYTLSNYFYFLLKMFIGFLIFSLVFGLQANANVLTCLLVPFFVLSVKLCFTEKSLRDCNKYEKIKNENKLNRTMWIIVGILFIAGALPPYLGFAIDEHVLWILTLLLLPFGIHSLIYIIKFENYRPIYKNLLNPESFALNQGSKNATAVQQLAMQKKITQDTTFTSNKTGYKYFNELFMKRHSKLLTVSAKRIAYIAALITIFAIGASLIFPEVKKEINKILLSSLPYFLFVMYLINRGKAITQAMFLNCDHSMLTYRSYRQPKAILLLFIERLKYIIIINLIPAVVIAIGLPLLLYITGGTNSQLNYILLFISIIAMSVFFSVHNIVLYYLLQPYNVNLETKSAAYGIINSITYMICYSVIRIEIPTLIFGSIISAFCVIYALVAFFLAYHFAPRTFKLRN